MCCHNQLDSRDYSSDFYSSRHSNSENIVKKKVLKTVNRCAKIKTLLDDIRIVESNLEDLISSLKTQCSIEVTRLAAREDNSSE